MYRQSQTNESALHVEAALHIESAPVACPQHNRLLRTLPLADLERLSRALRQVYLPVGTVLNEPGKPLRCIWFPSECIVSLVQVLADGALTGIAAVGNEGAVGFPDAGAEFIANKWIVQEPGLAYLLPRGQVHHEVTRPGPLFHALLRNTQALMVQIAQTAVCNRRHSIDQQLCRWLLESLDRLPSGRLTMTQESIAFVLGVRRESVSMAAARLQKQDVIRYTRGQIAVLDRRRLEVHTCECYGIVRNEGARLVPHCSVS